MRKVIMLLILIVLTGCSVTYNLEFNGNKFIEDIKIGKFNKEIVPEFDYLEIYSVENLNEQKFYNQKYFNKYLYLDYVYNYDEFRLSNVFNSCYDYSSVTYDDEYYYIVTSDSFKCLEYMGYSADEIKINFTTKYLVEESNADYIKGKTHTWIVNSENYDNKKISLKIYKDVYYENTFWDNLREGKYFNTFTISVFVFIVGFLIYKFFNWYSKRKNKI